MKDVLQHVIPQHVILDSILMILHQEDEQIDDLRKRPWRDALFVGRDVFFAEGYACHHRIHVLVVKDVQKFILV